MGSFNVKTAAKRMCELYPDTGDIAIILKTGAQEGLHNLPNTLESCLSCVKDIVILSDLDQKYGDIQIHDVLSRFSEENMKGNQEFNIYFKQKQLQADGEEDKIPALSEVLAIERDWRTKGRTAGWALDKYKWLHMLEAAWDYQPNREWYVFVETDTYLSWPNLKRWLRTLDPKKNFYGGLAIKKSDDREPIYFAQGGSGLVFSGALMKEFAVERRGIATKYERRMHEWWAGDFTLADVLYDEMGVKVTQMLPMVNQQPPRSVPMSKMAFCQAVIGMHHMKASDFAELFAIEKQLDFRRFRLQDAFGDIYPDGLPLDSVDWNNIADAHEWGVPIERHKLPPGLDANRDFETCRTACEVHEECFSFTFLNTTVILDESKADAFNYLNSCFLSRAFRLGAPKAEQSFWSNSDERDTYRRWHSGWMKDRISDWVIENWECKGRSQWEADRIYE